MSKNEFLALLEKKLWLLGKGEVEDIISEYSQHIDERVEEGKTEAEAIKDFGNIDDLVTEILSAYDIPDLKVKSATNVLSRLLTNFGQFITDFASSITGMGIRDLLKVLVKLAIVIAALFIVRLPFDLIANALSGMLRFLPGFIENVARGVIYGAVDIIFLILTIYVLYIFVQQSMPIRESYTAPRPQPQPQPRPESNEETREGNNQMEDEIAKTVKEAIDESMQTVNHACRSATDAAKRAEAAYYKTRVRENHPPMQRRPQGEENSVGDIFATMLLWCFRVFAFFIFIPVVFITLGIVVGFGVSATMLLQGYPMVGITLMALGSMICSVVLFVGLFSFIFKGKKKKAAILATEPEKVAAEKGEVNDEEVSN